MTTTDNFSGETLSNSPTQTDYLEDLMGLALELYDIQISREDMRVLEEVASTPEGRDDLLWVARIGIDQAVEYTDSYPPTVDDKHQLQRFLEMIVRYGDDIERLIAYAYEARTTVTSKDYYQAIADTLGALVIARGGAIGETESSSVTDEVSFLLDMDSAEFCNLDAVAVRKHLLELFTSVKLYAGSVADTANLDGEYKILEHNSNQPRLITINNGMYSRSEPLGWHTIRVNRGLSHGLVAWMDFPTARRKRKFSSNTRPVASHTVSDVEDSSIYIGYTIEGFGTVPLLRSAKTATGCHILHANGDELNPEAYNRPKINTLLKDALVHGEDNTIEILEELYYGSAGNPDFQKTLELALGLHLRWETDDMKAVESAMVQYKTTAERTHYLHKALRLDPELTATTEVCLIAQSVKGKYRLSDGREGKVYLGIRQVANAATQYDEYVFSLYLGGDDEIYDVANVVAYEKFRLTTDFINPTVLRYIDVSGNEQTPSDAALAELRKLIKNLSVIQKKEG